MTFVHRVPWFRLFCVAVCAVLTLVVLYPLLLTFLEAAGVTGEESVLGDALRAATSSEGLSILRNTVLVVLPATALALLAATVLAWVNERTDARIGFLANIVPVLPMFTPPIAGAIGWVFLGAPNSGFLNVWLTEIASWVGLDLTVRWDIFSWHGLILVYAIYLVPYAYIPLVAGFRNIDPATEEAARLAGAGAWATMRRVTVPSLGPSLGGAFLIVVATGFAMFSVPIVIGTPARIDVLSVSVVNAMTMTYPADTAAAFGYSGILIVLVGGAYLIQRRIALRAGHATIGGRGVRHEPTRLGRFRWPARLFTIGFLCATSVLPLFALVAVSLQNFWSSDLSAANLTVENYAELASTGGIADSLRNSVVIGIVVATVGMLVAAVTAYVTLRRRTRWGAVVDGVTKLPAPVPDVIFGVAILVALAGPPLSLSGTFAILGLGYLIVFLPQATVNANAAFLQVGPQLREAASVFGASDSAVFRRVLLRLMLPGLIAGWTFLFVLVAGDVNVAALLAGPGTSVAGFTILDLYSSGTYAEVAAMSVVMTVISATVVSIALAYSRRQSLRMSR